MQNKKRKNITFIDLFAGIGGTRLGYESTGAKCIWSSEWDTSAQKTYNANFDHIPEGDITKILSSDIPDHDVLLGGFPCQPFSIAGVSKKRSLGREHGFLDKAQGTLFFDIARILKDKKPAAFMLENVKNLVSHGKGRTFSTIIEVLEKDLNYKIFWKIIDARKVVPQHRERIYIVGFRDHSVNFIFPEIADRKKRLSDILEKKVDPKYTLTDNLWKYLQNYAKKQKEKGNGFGYSLFTGKDTARTLSARYYKDGSEILISQPGKNPRRLTPRECARLMGFPEDFKITVSDTQAYRQFGNSIVVPIVEIVAGELVKYLTLSKNGNTENHPGKIAKYGRNPQLTEQKYGIKVG